jgi:hypothetical protein
MSTFTSRSTRAAFGVAISLTRSVLSSIQPIQSQPAIGHDLDEQFASLLAQDHELARVVLEVAEVVESLEDGDLVGGWYSGLARR